MSTNLIPFSFESHEIRVVTHDDGSWSVVAKDVVIALEYAKFDSNLIAHVPEEWKGTNPIRTPGGTQEMLCLTEQGLYFFVGRSDKPKALPFQKWVFGEVLPTIRKTGKYEAEQKPAKPKLSREERDRLLLAREAFKTAKLFGFDGNMAILSADTFVRNTLGQGVLSDMGATHLIADAKGMTYTPTELGKLCDPPMTARQVNLALERAGLQTKELDHWLPTDAAIGHFEWVDTGKKHSTGVAPIRAGSDLLDETSSSQLKIMRLQ